MGGGHPKCKAQDDAYDSYFENAPLRALPYTKWLMEHDVLI
jgi:hypothetical protein